MKEKIRTAVVGAGEFGRRHLRAISQCEGAQLAAVVDVDQERARQAAAQYGCEVVREVSELAGRVDAAIVAVPTTAHAEVGYQLLEAGIDVLVEKPIASDLASAARLVETAARNGRILQVGHLERFNPAVSALRKVLTVPLFFEIHRLSPFTPRSLDVDVVLDLMIHDIDIVLSMVGMLPAEVQAAGISILSDKVDIANARLCFPNGCIANLTASRVSTERVRKLRLFQPTEYFSLDYTRQEVVGLKVTGNRSIASRRLETTPGEPLRLELEAFLECVRTRGRPLVSGEDGCRALGVALEIAGKIETHARLVSRTLASAGLK